MIYSIMGILQAGKQRGHGKRARHMLVDRLEDMMLPARVRGKISAHECGCDPFDDARSLFDLQFYLVAILFTAIDVMIACVLPWALTLSPRCSPSQADRLWVRQPKGMHAALDMLSFNQE